MAPRKPDIDPNALSPDGHDIDPVMTNAEVLEMDGDGNDLHELLTNAEVIQIRLEARAKIKAEKRAAAKEAMLKAEVERLKREEGLVTGGPEDELRSILIDISPIQLDRLVVNEMPYYHGHTYNVPIHVYRSLTEMMFRGWVHEHSVSGQPATEFYRKPRLTKLSGSGRITNAPECMH